MVLWAMVNHQSISIVVEILNTCSTGLFEEDIFITSFANKQIFLPYFLAFLVYEQCFDCCLIHMPLNYLKKTSSSSALLTNRYLGIHYVGLQIFSNIFFGFPGVWTMLWLLFEVSTIQHILFVLQNMQLAKNW